MGRRKERRLAAASGRRVKLDLFAEPSGDLGGSSGQEEVGGAGDSKTDAKLPSSPTSSGQQPQNPLLLLEQYSDDEIDEGPNEGHTAVEDASIEIDEEAKTAARRETEYGEIDDRKDPTIQKVEQLLMDDGSGSQDPLEELEKGSPTEMDSDDLKKQTNKMEEAAYPVASDHLVGDGSSGWKMVLHEESNQYYYWNIVTGETSWEVPDVFVQEAVTTSTEKVVDDTEGEMNTVMSTRKSSMPLDIEEDDITSRKFNVDSELNCETSDSAGEGTKRDGSDERSKGHSIDNEEVNKDLYPTNGTPMLGIPSVESKSGAGLPMQLIKQCESLLERLNSVKRSVRNVESRDLKLKCTLETEMRLADIKALASQGSSLLGFWLHSEGQLKQLEAAIDGLINRNNSASVIELEAILESCEHIGDDIEIDLSEKKAPFAAMESHAVYSAEKSNFEAHNGGATNMEQTPSLWFSRTDPVDDVGGKSKITRSEKENESTPKAALQSGEDVDMDVDMEVEDTSSIKSPDGGALGANYHVSTELTNLQNSLADQEPIVPGQVFNAPPVDEWIPPPPPDNEPFPPPPPDDEPFPPPPPDEPPETSYPPPHLGFVQPFPYSEQYTLPYSVSSLEYYGQTNLEASGTTLYTHSEGGQVAVSHLPQYYDAVSNMYAVSPVIVNPVEPTAYYGLQNGNLNPVPLLSGTAVPSGTLSEPVLETLDVVRAGSSDSHPEAVASLLLKTNFNLAKPGHGTVKAPAELAEALPSIGAPATSSATNNVFLSSISDPTTSVSTEPAATTTKSQSKVPRSKKRTVAVVSTLRSNKKVSSLVDKWKAAKEELHEEEEEPEDAYEILEKKRQREIEEWRAHQIATGEAKDNANFQPLGGDWRERIKRKRAQKIKEAGRSSPDVATDEKQQTDLTELSKGLPSGWQVYWDDSSKQVYYGNVWTSETTWNRPTD